MQFTKLFNSILDSTIWQESKETKLIWVTMLAMSDKDGDIHASIPGLASRAGVSIEECEEALKCLLSPDKYSRTKDNEGRRIAEIDGGWVLLNHAKYRALLSAEERREYMRRKQQESRERRSSKTVNVGQSLSTLSTHTEAEAEAEAKTPVPVAGASLKTGKSKNSSAFLNLDGEDLDSPERIKSWHDFAAGRDNPLFVKSEASLLNVMGAAVHASRAKDARSRVGVFAGIVQKGYSTGGWELITHAEEDEARKRIKKIGMNGNGFSD